VREKALAQPKRNDEQAQGANQSAGQASQDKAAPPADTESPPQTAGQTESQHPVPGGPYDFHTDQWAALYAKRLDAMIAALKSKGVPVIWVGLPAIRGTKATSDMSYLDELYRERAERAGIILKTAITRCRVRISRVKPRRLRGQQLAYIYFEE
jgi:hypothetical protein